MFTLTISIPTYNRASILEMTVNTLLQQIDQFNLHNEVEVLVCDNASTDNTSEIISALQKKGRYNLTYFRNEENIGVIRNILKTLELSKGKFWMFYGDDDKVPDNNLIEILNCLKENSTYPAFMFRQHDYNSPSFKNYPSAHSASLKKLSTTYFYYIGNAGVFALDTALAKKAMEMDYNSLLQTCWPQTEIFFIAAHLSSIQEPVYLSTVEATHAYIPNLNFNSAYYFFETTLYSQLRSAISIHKIINADFVQDAKKSMFAVEFNDSFNTIVSEHYLFYDYKNEKEEFIKSLNEAKKNIPSIYNKEILELDKLIRTNKIWLAMKLYLNFLRQKNKFGKISPIKKLLLNTPFGYTYIIKQKQKQKIEFYKQKGRKAITSESGYF